MATVPFDGGWVLNAPGSTATDSGGHAIMVKKIVVLKTTADGTVTFKDGDGNVVLTTNTIVTGDQVQIDIGIVSSGFEFDAASAGSAVVNVFGSAVGG